EMKTYPIVALFIALLSTGCAVGPNYQRPAVQTPLSFRAPEPLPAAQGESFADLKWFEVFKDEQLQELVRTALVQNYDLRDAVARVEAARASLGITRSEQFPQVIASGDVQFHRSSRDGSLPQSPAFLRSLNRTFGGSTLGLLSFDAEPWGRLRRSTD